MKLFIFFTLWCRATAFLVRTSNLNNQNIMTNPLFPRNNIKLFYQNPRDVIFSISNLEMLERKSRVQSSSKIESLLDKGKYLVIQLREGAIKVGNDAISGITKKTYTDKFITALLHLKKALHIARDADLKMGLCYSRESLKAWNEMDRIFNNLESHSFSRAESNTNDIIAICNELEIVFNKFH